MQACQAETSQVFRPIRKEQTVRMENLADAKSRFGSALLYSRRDQRRPVNGCVAKWRPKLLADVDVGSLLTYLA